MSNHKKRVVCTGVGALSPLGHDWATVSAMLRGRRSAVQRLAAWDEIDGLNVTLSPLNSFVLPGGRPAAAYLHQARTVVRRAERLTVELAAREPVSLIAIKYLNRLSDHLFVLGRFLNDRGRADVLWVPGANR